MVYKKAQGLSYATPFCQNSHCLWNATTVLRILKNPVYTGVLTQGKSTAPCYGVRRRVEKPRGEWDVVEGTHEALIDKRDFAVVQRLLARDTRTSPGAVRTELFSGMVFCGECGGAMVRKTVPSKDRKYVYYICGTHKSEKICYSHSLPVEALEKIVLTSVQGRIYLQGLPDAGASAGIKKEAAYREGGIQRWKRHLESWQAEAEKYRQVLDSLYGNLIKGVIDGEEYMELKTNYRRKLTETEREIEKIRQKVNRAAEKGTGGSRRWEQIEKCGNITELDRAMAAFLIERIFIRRDKRVEIVYDWREE